MLPPFRIRHVRASHGPFGPDLGDDLSPFVDEQLAIFQIAAPEYDAIISDHPEATLTYMDEDDGEVITVGSSLELSQRLEEPVPDSSALKRQPSWLYPRQAKPALPSFSSASHSTHVFDVDRSERVLQLWRKVRQDNGYQPKASSSVSNKGKGRASSPPGTLSSRESWSEGPTNDLKDQQIHKSDINSRQHELLATQKHSDNTDVSPRVLSPNKSSLCENLLMHASHTEVEQDGTGRESTTLLHSHSPSVTHSPPHKNEQQIPLKAGKPDVEAKSSSGNRIEQVPEDRSRVPLLEAFEKELRHMVNGSTNNPETPPVMESCKVASTQELATPPLTSTAPADQPSSPGELFTKTIRSVLGGLSVLTSELRSNIPQAQEQFTHTQQHLHQSIERALQNTLFEIGPHVQHLAQALQEASIATHDAAKMTREADFRALESAVQGLRDFALGIGEFSKGLFARPETPAQLPPSMQRKELTCPGPRTADTNEANTVPLNNNASTSIVVLKDANTPAPISLDVRDDFDGSTGRMKNSFPAREECLPSDARTSHQGQFTPEERMRDDGSRPEPSTAAGIDNERTEKSHGDIQTTPAKPHNLLGDREPDNLSDAAATEPHRRSSSDSEESMTEVDDWSRYRQRRVSRTNTIHSRRAENHRGRFSRRSSPKTLERSHEYITPSVENYQVGKHRKFELPLLSSKPYHKHPRSRSPPTWRRPSPLRRRRSPNSSSHQRSDVASLPLLSALPNGHSCGRHLPEKESGTNGGFPLCSTAHLPARDPGWAPPITHPVTACQDWYADRHSGNTINPAYLRRDSMGPSSFIPPPSVVNRTERLTENRQPPGAHNSAVHVNSTAPWSERKGSNISVPSSQYAGAMIYGQSIVAENKAEFVPPYEKVKGIDHLSPNHTPSYLGTAPTGSQAQRYGPLRAIIDDHRTSNDLGRKKGENSSISSEHLSQRSSPSLGEGNWSRPGKLISPSGLPFPPMSANYDPTFGYPTTPAARLPENTRPDFPSSSFSMRSLSEKQRPRSKSIAQESGESAPAWPSSPCPLERTADDPTSNVIPGAWPKPESGSASETAAPWDTLGKSSRDVLEAYLRAHPPNTPYKTAELYSLSCRCGLPFRQVQDYVSRWRGDPLRRPVDESSGAKGYQSSSLRNAPPIQPANLSAPQPGARLAGPFDPIAESVTLHRRRLLDGIRRSASERVGSNTRSIYPGRPVSEINSRQRRMGWESFLESYENTPGRFPVDDRDHVAEDTGRHGNNDADLHRPDLPAAMSDAPTSVDRKVRKCVDLLRTMGFGTDADGGSERLHVYAQAADGDFETALEIIEEDRKAHEARNQ
ncbi:MAG: hypothetical protein M1837_002884 [Sclerophora amabilis]|nr:MAG: hypothetical protein M1837_002884 [Sclerophora amabilis]